MRILTFCIFAAVVPNTYPNVFDTIFRIIKNRADDIIDKAGENSHCASDLKTLFRDLIRRKIWAFEMLDASGKLPTGLLTGNFYVAGNFDQCLNIHEEKNNTIIDGQYCTVTLTPSSQFVSDAAIILDTVAFRLFLIALLQSRFLLLETTSIIIMAYDVSSFYEYLLVYLLPAADYVGINVGTHTQQLMKLVRVTYGLCIPTSCTIGNLQTIWNYIEHTFRVPVHVAFVDILCRSKDKPVEPYPVDPYIIAAFGCYICILLASTLYDILINKSLKDSSGNQVNYLTTFSIYSNAKKLFSFPQSSDDGGGLKCINGMKVISMFWIIFGHRVVVNMFSANLNARYIFQWWKNIENTPIMAASFAVDTFFVLSGLLLSYIFLKNQHLFKKKGMPIGLFYVYRILRLSPALLATILFYIGIYKRLTDGPAWPMISRKLSGGCYHVWWATLFFFSNFIPFRYQCIEQSWYLAVDTQLYFISPFILQSLLKYPKKTIFACIAACLASAVYSFVITMQNEYGAIYYEGNHDFYQHIYVPTFVRMPAWLIGIMMGYIIFKFQQISIPKCVNVFIWAFLLSLMMTIILIHVVFGRNSYDPLRSAIFNAFARPAWGFAVSLVIFLCATRHGGLINTFLSLPIFQVLVRLSYSTYLVHFGLLLYFLGRKKTVGYFSNLNSIHDFVGDIFFIFIVATVWCLAFETPFINIGKIIMQKGMSGTVAKKEIGKNTQRSRKRRNKKKIVVCVYSYEDLQDKKSK